MPEEAAGWDASAEAWIRNVETDATRIHVLDAPMLEECGDVNGREVVDIGCGEGRFSRMLAERGARISGIDPTEPFVQMARQKHPQGDYRVGFAEELPYPNDAFDVAISYLVLLDVDDYKRAIAEMMRVLKPGGRIVVTNIQAFVTTRVNPWVEDESGRRLYVAVDNYFEERADVIEWNEISIINYHRPLSAYMDAFLDQGLKLVRFREPVPTAESVKQLPRLADFYRVPYMYVMSWEKPGTLQ